MLYNIPELFHALEEKHVNHLQVFSQIHQEDAGEPQSLQISTDNIFVDICGCSSEPISEKYVTIRQISNEFQQFLQA